jgi:hypothetical protein
MPDTIKSIKEKGNALGLCVILPEARHISGVIVEITENGVKLLRLKQLPEGRGELTIDVSDMTEAYIANRTVLVLSFGCEDRRRIARLWPSVPWPFGFIP